jgi:hypothetical protein
MTDARVSRRLIAAGRLVFLSNRTKKYQLLHRSNECNVTFAKSLPDEEMNSIVDVIPALILCSAGAGVIGSVSLMWFEHIAERRANAKGLQHRFPAFPAASRKLVVLGGKLPQTPAANTEGVQAAA